MRNNFPTKEQLMGMSLAQLRLIDIQEKDEEELLQEIVLLKQQEMPPVAKVFRGDIPDIKTPEQEAHFQEVVNQRTEAIQPTVVAPTETPTETPTVTPGSKCDVCGKEFKTVGALRMHKGRFHK
jgi:hypothetical protein